MILTLALAAFGIVIAIRRLNWSALFKDSMRLQLSIVSMLIVASLWVLRSGIRDGLEVHFFGLTALTLTLGWRLAVLISSTALLIVTAVGVVPWHLFGPNLLFHAVGPVSLTYFIFLLSRSFLPRHLFIYTFISGFFNAAITLSIAMFSFALYLYFTDAYSWRVLADDYLITIVLLFFPEGLINGMSLTALVVYRPEWVCTFSDNEYLFNKKR